MGGASDDSIFDRELNKWVENTVSGTLCDMSRASRPSKHKACLLPCAGQCGLSPRIACILPVEVRVFDKVTKLSFPIRNYHTPVPVAGRHKKQKS